MSSNTNLVFCSQKDKSFTSKVDIYASALVAVLIFSRPRAITPTVMDARGGKFPDEIQGGHFNSWLVSFGVLILSLCSSVKPFYQISEAGFAEGAMLSPWKSATSWSFSAAAENCRS